MSAKRKGKPGRPKTKNPKKKDSFTISPEAHAALAEVAKRTGLSRSQIVDKCLRCQILKDCPEFFSAISSIPSP
jgi:hypothetical protein